jgi:hypothetical protein
MSKGRIEIRLVGTSIIMGAILMLIATILHPPLVNPYDGETAFREYYHSELWMWDHILMLGAVSLWLLGLAGSASFISDRHSIGSHLFFVSLGLWILILTAELTVLPLIGKEILINSNVTLIEVWEAMFSFALLAGYFAVACSWLGVSIYGWEMKHHGNYLSNWFKNGALYTGIIGFIGIILTCMSFEAGYILIPLTSGPAFLWTMWLGWKMLKGSNPRVCT